MQRNMSSFLELDSQELEYHSFEKNGVYQTICELAPIGIMLSDNEGNDLYSNRRWDDVWGVSSTESLVENLARNVHPEDRQEILGKLGEIRKGRSYSFECRLLDSKSDTVWVRLLGSPVKRKDLQVAGYVWTVENISSLHHAMQESMKAKILQSLEMLAGGITHDLNSILTIILGNISLAQMKLHDPLKSGKYLAKAEDGVLRAHDLALKLLMLSPGGKPVKKIIAVDALLKNAASSGAYHASVKCEICLANDLWLVDADEGQLRQVIHNLMLNAVQAMPNGGIITLGAKNTHIAGGKKYVEIYVTDTGTGISSEYLDKIFEPYFTTKSACSGLGLSICNSMIAKHGGHIKVKTSNGKGCSIYIYLPAISQIINSPLKNISKDRTPLIIDAVSLKRK